MSSRELDERRLAFGRVAELYDRARPSYPDSLFERLIEFAALRPGDAVLEVGAGTGKATVALAQRGLSVLALEPDGAMAGVLRRNCEPYPRVAIEQAEFERWRPPRRSRALVCAQAWHWLDATERYRRAADAIAPRGALAALWTFPRWQQAAARAPLCEAYRRFAPELAPSFPMHPASAPFELAGDWSREIAASAAWFGEPEVHVHEWAATYSSASYLALLETHQDHILLAGGTRERLLSALAEVLAEAGGAIELPLHTQLCLARRI